jgi:hypothetical protein
MFLCIGAPRASALGYGFISPLRGWFVADGRDASISDFLRLR